MKSEQIVIEAPMSFVGATKRINKLNKLTITSNIVTKIALRILTTALTAIAWIFILCWYLIFGLLLVPYRLVRRSARKQKLDKIRHSELLRNR